MRKGQSFKDYISPDGFEFKSDYFKVGDKYARVLFIRDYPSYIKDKVIWELTDSNRNMIFNFDIVPVFTDEAQEFVEKQALGIETNITNYQRKQNTTVDEQSPEQYAADEVTEGIQKGIEDSEIVAEKTVQTGVRKVKKKIKQRKQTPPKTRGELSVKKPKAEQQPVKYAHKADIKIKQTARSSANAKNTIKTAENSAKTAHKAEKTAQKSVETAKRAKKAEEAAKKTAQATAKTAKAVGKAVAEATKATAAAVKELGAAIAAGGAPVVIINMSVDCRCGYLLRHFLV